jgi:5-methylcytosine-specific restriction enzyme subunit McrC
MSDPSVVRVFEYDRLDVGDRGFEQRHWELLGRWAERQAESYFEIWPGRVRFLQWVGVIEIDGLVIEVLPKAERHRSQEDQAVVGEKWRRILLSLLRYAGYLDVRAIEEARLGSRDTTLLDIVFSQFLDSLESLLREGLVKRYRLVASDRTAVKGRIDHATMARKNRVHAERLSTIAFEYDRINPMNLALKAAARAASMFAPSGYTRSRARGLGLYFVDWPDARAGTGTFESFRFDRKSERYARPLALARLILERLNPDLTTGGERVFSLLFDMNDLWEKAILARLRREAASAPGTSVEGQRIAVFWRSEAGSVKVIRPDIVIKSPKGKTTILDTKWKVLSVPVPADADLKQVFAYNEMWDANDGYLVYPKVPGAATVNGRYQARASGTDRGCGLLFASVDPDEWEGERLLSAIGITSS